MKICNVFVLTIQMWKFAWGLAWINRDHRTQFIRNQPRIEDIDLTKEYKLTDSIQQAIPQIKAIRIPDGYWYATYVHHKQAAEFVYLEDIMNRHYYYISPTDTLIYQHINGSVNAPGICEELSPYLHGKYLLWIHACLYIIEFDVTLIYYLNDRLRKKFISARGRFDVHSKLQIRRGERLASIIIGESGVFLDNGETFAVSNNICNVNPNIVYIGKVIKGATEIPGVVSFSESIFDDFDLYSCHGHFIGIQKDNFVMHDTIKNVKWPSALRTKPALH